MRPALLRFAREISRRTDGTRMERQDLEEEMAGHLEATFSRLIEEGHTEQEAEELAMSRFGDGKRIGRQIQQALYPYRREMILGLSAGSLLFGFAVFFSVLLTAWSAYIPWLILCSLTGSALLALAVDPPASLNRRFVLNGLFLLQTGVLLSGILLTSAVPGNAGSILAMAGWLLILLAMALVYRTSAYDYRTRRVRLEKHDMAINAANVTTGILSVSISLFILWAYLAFSDGTDRVWMFALIPALFWALTYAAQWLLLAKGRVKTAYGITGLQIAVIAAALALFFRIT
ncbi:permease prefix domain 1-containing protein [Edaphobacillus lindanitolerans]|uniref:Uncharacterized protein n=1 Tax=Edaphobacillus lindanitolerans TaxID=550447 RepID=A0A1U7PTQ0_9BACI|nr:permease prefix domain 1-containing protein [Edaphobacillus lindanitolerans]SIT92707.1 hypothetical protein SAMN05428946_2840 [Edaphobacillus lindanitolerans]